MCPSPDPSIGARAAAALGNRQLAAPGAAPAGLGVRRAARRDPAGAFPAGRGGGAHPRLGEGGGRGGRLRVAVAQARRGAQGHRLHHRLKV